MEMMAEEANRVPEELLNYANEANQPNYLSPTLSRTAGSGMGAVLEDQNTNNPFLDI